jgi:NifB/MoaA-like Fe-S oxidoreductase
MAGGVSAEPFFREAYQKLLPYHITVDTRSVKNRFFGESVTVGGLVTGGDLIAQLADTDFGRALLIPRAMLKKRRASFWTLIASEAEAALNTLFLPVATGETSLRFCFTE